METDTTATDVQHIYRAHIEDYLAALADKGLTGTTRARKLISLRVLINKPTPTPEPLPVGSRQMKQ